MTLSIIAAVARDGAIGMQNGLPWPKLQHDMTWFKRITTAYAPFDTARHLIERGMKNSERFIHTPRNACIMGWRTYVSIGETLPQRTSIVLRDTTYYGAGDWPCKARTFSEALEKAIRLSAAHVFAIGGARVFTEALLHPECHVLYITEVDAHYPEADTWFPWMRLHWNDGILYVYNHGCKMPYWFQRHRISPWIQDDMGPKYRLTIWERFS